MMVEVRAMRMARVERTEAGLTGGNWEQSAVRSASEAEGRRPADKQEQTIEDGNGYGGGGGEQVPCSETVQGRRLERGGRALVAMVAIRSVWVACACGGYRQVARGVRGSGDACCMGCKEGVRKEECKRL